MINTRFRNPPARKPHYGPEEQLQRAVVQFLHRAATPSLMWMAIPNGGGSKGENGRKKAMGVRAGVPDLAFVYEGRAMYIEMKAQGGRLSGEQTAFRNWCREHDVPWALCRSLEEVEAALTGWDVPLRATTIGRAAA